MMKRMIRFFLPFVPGICCFVVYTLIGSDVAPDGTLLEPFFLIPLGWFLIGLGMLVNAGMFFFHAHNPKNPKRKDNSV
jgi:hypothetical protein